MIIGLEGVTTILKNMKVDKASGPDCLPNRVLKECATQLAPGITAIFQRSVDDGELPTDWRNANVAPIFKKGDRHLAENYRPVSLTSVLSKQLEHIICHHMLNHLDKHSVLTSLNHGFRSGYSCETQLVVTAHDIVNSYDKNEQVDIMILDFSKAFDTVPHNKLLHKLDSYGIRGPLHKWLNSFLSQRQMRVVNEGEFSREVPVLSGVPQGTVLGPLLFLCHINDLPECVKSQTRLFADDCLLYRPIKHERDHVILQDDLNQLHAWANRWGMRFNGKKCYVLSVQSKSSHFYNINNQILQQVPQNPYLGLTFSEDLKWNVHINNVIKKSNSTLGFLRRNLKHCPKDCKKNAYISLVRSQLEYGSIIWDPYIQKDIDRLERTNRLAARFITNDYKSREEGSVTNMLQDLGLPPLQDRRRDLRLTFLFKVVEGLVPAIDINDYLRKQRPKRTIRAKRFENFVTKNIVENSVNNNSKCFDQITASTEIYKQSFFPRTVLEWNRLPDSIVCAESVEGFKSLLTSSD